MFYGHFCASWIIKVLEPRIPLWVLLVAVQFVDYLFSLFILIEIEEAHVVHGFTKVNDMKLVSIPYTHSLIAVIGWSIAFGLWYKFSGYGGGNRAAFLVGLAVLSHWFEDLLVHSEDLLLLTIDNTAPKYGFDLWNYPEICYSLEFILFYGSYYYYLVNTKVHPSKDSTNVSDNGSNTKNYWASKWGPITISLDSLFTIISTMISPSPSNCKLLCIFMLCLYLKITYLAHQLDKVRISKYK